MRTLPDIVTTTRIDGRDIRRDEAGYLVDPGDWSRKVAEHLAAEEGLALTPAHWRVLLFMRDFLDAHGVMADARFVFKHIGEDGRLADGRKRFFDLFPYGYVRQACKIAGMRQPRAWSTG
ncbi:MAG: TusE/DsrC/DsvC family sulfur relay protein [Rhizobiaceae bacterium]